MRYGLCSPSIYSRCNLIGILRAERGIPGSGNFHFLFEGLTVDFAQPVIGSDGTGGKAGDEIEDRVAEAADVEDVWTAERLGGGVRR